jgi:hypothetical protein
MRTKVMVLLLAAWFLVGVPGAQATPWTSHYSVNNTVTPQGGNKYLFEYAITKLDQGGSWQGLDDFYLQIPLTATILNITDPPPYTFDGVASWIHDFNGAVNPYGAAISPLAEPGYQWIEWWGHWGNSVYPPGTTATFSVELDKVSLGYNDAAVVTYLWVPAVTYTGYEGRLLGPVTTAPLPPGIVLFGSGLVGLGFWRPRFNKA